MLVLKKLEALGHQIFYATIHLFGQAGAYLLLLPVVLVYVAGSRKIHRCTRPYLEKRFPGQGALSRWCGTFRQVLSFGQIMVDRAWLGLKKEAVFDGEAIEGFERLAEIVTAGKGLILLTAHVGNWQTALHRICRLPVKVNSLMHYEAEAVSKHFFDLTSKPCPFAIISTASIAGGMIEATLALQKGEVVTVMGDRPEKGSATRVDFLGSPVRFPVAAYALAASTGAPIAVLLAAKTGRKSYHLQVWKVFSPQKAADKSREVVFRQAAAIFAGCLEEYLQLYPYQWHNFYDIWKQ